MPLDILQQYATFKQRAKGKLDKAIADRAQLDNEINMLQNILGEMGGGIRTPRMAKTSGLMKSTSVKRGKKKRIRRSPEQLKDWATAIIQVIKGAKNGAKKGDVEKASGEKLPQLWVGLVEKHSGTKLKREGDKSTAKYFLK
jgi:hypothetical protein